MSTQHDQEPNTTPRQNQSDAGERALVHMSRLHLALMELDPSPRRNLALMHIEHAHAALDAPGKVEIVARYKEVTIEGDASGTYTVVDATHFAEQLADAVKFAERPTGAPSMRFVVRGA